jgi:hypothetical protein
MAIGLTGMSGATVLSRVGEECRKDQGLVPTPHRHLEESRVLGRVKNLGNAMKTLVQVNGFLTFLTISQIGPNEVSLA